MDNLDQYFGDPDRGKEVKEAFKQNLLEIQRKRTAGRATISAVENMVAPAIDYAITINVMIFIRV